MTVVLGVALAVAIVGLFVMARLLASQRAFIAARSEGPPSAATGAAEPRSFDVEPPYRLVSARHGWMLVNVNDFYLGQAIVHYGECCEIEVAFLKRLCDLRPGTVLEIGANVGTHTVPLARHLAAQGRGMQAFEPQPFIFQNLCANLSLNGLDNVLAWPMACGEVAGTVRFDRPDYNAVGNFGGISMSSDGQAGNVDVPSVALDQFVAIGTVAMMKVDVEGFELHVLKGAERILDACRPVLYVENDRPEKSSDLIDWLWKKDYRLWWHPTPLFNPDNFFGDRHNRYGNVVSLNMLCLPREVELPFTGLESIDSNRHPLQGRQASAANEHQEG